MKKITLLILVISSAALLFPRGAIDRSDNENLVELTGVIKIKGNEPHTSVILETEEGVDYVLTGPEADILRKEFQLKTVKIEAEKLTEAEGKRLSELHVTRFNVIK